MKPVAKITCSMTVEYSLIRENISIQDEKITQLYIIQSKYDPFLWFGLLFVDTGIYQGSVMRFNMAIPSSYPDSPCPKIFFDPIPYHPLVDPDSGELDTKNAFPDWNSTTHKLHQLLTFVKQVIHRADVYIGQIVDLLETNILTTAKDRHDSETCDNPDLKIDKNNQKRHENMCPELFDGKITSLFKCFEHSLSCINIFKNDYQEFNRLNNIFKRKCFLQLYDKPNPSESDENTLYFTEWDPDLHEITRQCIFEGRFKPTYLFASYHKETDRVSFVPGPESA